jgi:urease beta subunit
VIPGEIVHPDGPVEGNVGVESVELEVANTSDRAIQVTSHFHFFETNRRLAFDRARALGMRLDVPAGLSVRFEAGERRTVRLRPLAGRRVVRGFNRLVEGAVDDPTVRAAALQRARAEGFLGAG